jgi:Flp pilus assembly protein TadD
LHAALAGLYAADARWADAAQEYFIALSMDPGDSDLAFNVAASLDQNHNSAAALTYYAQALSFAKLRPAQIDVRAIEGRMRQLQARIEVRPATPQATP